MIVQQIPCGVSTSALVPNAGLSGLGRRRGMGCACRKGIGNYVAQTGAIPSSDIFGLTPKGRSCSCNNGLTGLFDGTGLLGSGLFTSGMDYTQWGIGEYAALAVGGYVLMSVFSTTKRTAGVVRRKARAAARA